MNYTVKLTKCVSIYDAEEIISNANQKWGAEDMHNRYSDNLCISKIIDVEVEDDLRLMKYITALQELSGHEITVVAADSNEATYAWNEDELRWEKKIRGTVLFFNFEMEYWESF